MPTWWKTWIWTDAPSSEGQNDPTSIDIEEMKKMVDIFMERGFTYFDTAYPYHNEYSEAAFRKAVVERYPRDKFTVTDKMPCWEVREEADLERIFNEQLSRCGVDYFDYYWLHSMNKAILPTWSVAMASSSWHARRRKAKSAISDSSSMTILPLWKRFWRSIQRWNWYSYQINYIDWNSPSIESAPVIVSVWNTVNRVIVMEPVKGGSLARVPADVENVPRHAPRWVPASWAIRYAASLPSVMMVLSGMSNVEQMLDNTSFGERLQNRRMPLWRVLPAKSTIPSPSPYAFAHYCTDGCPLAYRDTNISGLMNTRKQFLIIVSTHEFLLWFVDQRPW